MASILCVFDVVTKQIVLLDTDLVNWVCLHFTVAVFHADWTF